MNPRNSRHRGFSLIEVLVALIIIGVGMLGIAKIQALAYASTGTAAARSIAAIEASSLAAAMRANRDYWTTAAVGGAQTITITTAGVVGTSTDGSLLSPGPCATSLCNKQQVAAYDLGIWGASLYSALPGSTATVTCVPPGPLVLPLMPAGTPVGCTIQVTWNERNIGLNTQSQGTTMALPTYTLYVEP